MSDPGAGAQAMRIRDVPESCICVWEWSVAQARWVLAGQLAGCPWHEDGSVP